MSDIRFENVSAGYGEHLIIKNRSFVFPERGTVAISGASGSGKTTVLRLLCGLLAPVSGRITGLSEKKVSFVFQEDRLLPWCTAQENAAVAGDAQLARELLEEMELSEYLDAYPSALSGGMQRRVAIARALCFGGDVFLLDEPFKGLDDALKERIIPRMRARIGGLTVISTHDLSEAALFDPQYIPFSL